MQREAFQHRSHRLSPGLLPGCLDLQLGNLLAVTRSITTAIVGGIDLIPPFNQFPYDFCLIYDVINCAKI